MKAGAGRRGNRQIDFIDRKVDIFIDDFSQLTLLPNTRRTEKAVLGKFFVMRNAERRESGFCFS